MIPWYRLKQILIISLIILCSIFLIHQYNYGKKYKRIKFVQHLDEKDRYGETITKMQILHSDRDRDQKNRAQSSIRVDNKICNIPKLEINSSELIQYFETPEPLPCQKKSTLENQNWVIVDEAGKIKFAENRKKSICKIQYFWRRNDFQNDFGPEIKIQDGYTMKDHDYATVTCVQGLQNWKSVLWYLAPRQEIHKVAKEKAKNRKKKKNRKAYNVLFLGFDSISQMSFRRKLPKTVEYLEKEIESVVLNGYNIVGDGTPQAFIPILTGKTEEELPLTRKRFHESKYVDDVYPFVWNNFSDAGYMTMYGEDAYDIGTFTYRLKGFRNQPTHHFTTPLFKMTEKMRLKMCIGSIPFHQMWFDIARQFQKIYEDVPRFLLMHQSLLSHDDINLVQVQDDHLKKTLKSLNDEGVLDDTFLIVMADHGHRFAKFRATHQGQLEERLPFFSIQLPKNLRQTEKGKKMLKNLKDNKDRLTSPFDIHATLLNILNLENEGDDDVTNYDKMQDNTQRSLSLFRPIPEHRTCLEAGIEAHWCTCLSWQDSMSNKSDHQLSMRLARSVVEAINHELQMEEEMCNYLKLAELKEAKKLLPEKNLLAYTNAKDKDGYRPDLSGKTQVSFAHYQLKFRTTPGDAIYEVTLFYDFVEDEAKVDFGSISHINKYGKNPDCIISKNYYLATFCVCKNQS